MLLAKRFRAKEIFVAGKPDYVYDKDFVKYKSACALKRIDWKSYRRLISRKWAPGSKAPVDPVAAGFAQRHKIKAIILKGDDLGNLYNALREKKFKGTIILP
jgi:uridylate kinase